MQGFERRSEHREKLLDAVVAHLVDHPFEQLSLMAVADACGVSMWALRYNYKNVERLFRATAAHLIKRVLRNAVYEQPKQLAVAESLRHYGIFLSELTASKEYRDLLYVVIRNGRHHQWLEEEYERRIVAKFCRELEQVVKSSARRPHGRVLLRKKAARKFFKRIETEFALSALLPRLQRGEAKVDVDKVLKEVVRDAFDATYVVDGRYVFEVSSANAA